MRGSQAKEVWHGVCPFGAKGNRCVGTCLDASTGEVGAEERASLSYIGSQSSETLSLKVWETKDVARLVPCFLGVHEVLGPFPSTA